jgi:hypothetical protein
VVSLHNYSLVMSRVHRFENVNKAELNFNRSAPSAGHPSKDGCFEPNWQATCESRVVSCVARGGVGVFFATSGLMISK